MSECRAQPNVPQLQKIRQRTTEPANNATSDSQTTAVLPTATSTGNVQVDGGLHFPAPSIVGDMFSQPDFVAMTNTDEMIPERTSLTCDVPSYSTYPASSQQGNMQLGDFDPQSTALDLQPSDSYPFCTTTQDVIFWDDDFQFSAPLGHGQYADFDLLLPLGQQPTQIEVTPSESGLEQSLSDSGAPVPSFLDVRSSPEPQEGQGGTFDDFLHKTWPKRRHLYVSVRENQATTTGRVPWTPSVRTEKPHYPPLIGGFSSVLSFDGSDGIWEPENLAHVRPLPQQVYNDIVVRYKKLNDITAQYTPFATGDFPSLAACNAFMQLFFEDFNPLLPIIHTPTFDPAQEHWLLVLAVLSTGCRFSHVPSAVECVDVLQEFVRRAFLATVCDV